MRLIKLCLCAGLFILPGQVNAAFIKNGDNTITDDTHGLDWLALSVTAGQAYSQVETLNTGWRYATNSEVENMFSMVFDGYYDTNPQGYSSSRENPYADQSIDFANFTSLFGLSNDSSTADLTVQRSFGLYENELNQLTYLGTFFQQSTTDTWEVVLGPNLLGNFEAMRDTIGGQTGTFMVRQAAASVPESPSLFMMLVGVVGLFGSVGSSILWSKSYPNSARVNHTL